jgi:GAF domain-containing protein
MNDSQRLSEVFVELADTLVTDFDVVEFMTMLARRCVEVFHAGDAGVVLADERGTLHSVGASHESARLLDLFEIQNEEGPCLDCYRTGEQVLNASLAPPDDRWPIFAPEARRRGFAMAHALPMRLRGTVLGAVNLFATDEEPLTASDVAVGQALADIATIGLLQERTLREARVLAEQLQAALTSRIIIEQAKGMLAEHHDTDMNNAFESLRRYARNNNRRLRDVAEALLDGVLSAEDIPRTP